MQLKEFSLLVPIIESGTLLKALETAIPSAAIDQAISNTEAQEQRKRAIPVTSSYLSDYCYEFVVFCLYENSAKKSRRWFE